MKKTLVVLLSAVLFSPGCSDMGETGQNAMIGTLMGTAAGALLGKNKKTGALIGAGVGLLGGSLYGKNKECNRLRQENALLNREREELEMRREIERLRLENDRLRTGKTDAAAVTRDRLWGSL